LFILAGRAERVIPLQAKAASRVEEPAAFVRVSTARQAPIFTRWRRAIRDRPNFNPSRKAH